MFSIYTFSRGIFRIAPHCMQKFSYLFMLICLIPDRDRNFEAGDNEAKSKPSEVFKYKLRAWTWCDFTSWKRINEVANWLFSGEKENNEETLLLFVAQIARLLCFPLSGKWITWEWEQQEPTKNEKIFRSNNKWSDDVRRNLFTLFLLFFNFFRSLFPFLFRKTIKCP